MFRRAPSKGVQIHFLSTRDRGSHYLKRTTTKSQVLVLRLCFAGSEQDHLDYIRNDNNELKSFEEISITFVQTLGIQENLG